MYENGLSSWEKEEREWITKGIMLAEVSWSTGRNTLTSGWNSSAMPGGISQPSSLLWGKRLRRGRSQQPVKMPPGQVQMEN